MSTIKASVKNLSPTIIPKSDQLNAEQLLSGNMTITVTDVRVSESPEQPVIIHYEGENGRPFKPCKTTRKILLFAWGEDGTKWIGRSMTLFNDPEVKWAGVKVGGIRISHMSDIEKELSLSLTQTRGKKEPFIIKKLGVPAATKPAEPPATVTDTDIQSARDQLDAAYPFGLDTLKNCWMALRPEIRAALGKSVIDEYKVKAEQKVETPPVVANQEDEF